MKKISKREVNKRWILFALGLILSLFFCYQFALKKTILLAVEYYHKTSSAQQNQRSNISHDNINGIKQTIIMRQYVADTTLIRKNLLDSINNLCNQFNCTITNFPNSFVNAEHNQQLLNNTIDLEGSYFNLLKIMHEIESNNFYGKINAFSFYVVSDLRTKRKSLHLQLYLQHLISK